MNQDNISSTTGCSLKDNRIATGKRVKETGYNYSSQPKEDIKVCDLCSHQGFETYCHQDRYCFPARSLRCKNCGLIFLSPRMTKEAYDDFYENWYRTLVDAFNSRGESTEQLDIVRKMQATELCEFLKNHLPTEYGKERLLDIGGSTGTFAQMCCQKFGFKSGAVVDPSKKEIQEAAKRGLTVSIGGIESFTNQPKAYSFISLLKTIEHVLSIKRALEKICLMLKDDGFVLIDCVDHEWLVNLIRDRTLTTKIDHIYQLTEKTVERYFEQAGLTIFAKERKMRYLIYLLKKDEHIT